MIKSSTISPCLWFNGEAEAAAQHYTAIFSNSRIIDTVHFTEVGPGPQGAVMVVAFELDGQPFAALNGGPKFGGPDFKFTEAISLQVICETQAEVDHHWDRLCQGGQPGPCGWLKDKFGVSWQVTPRALLEMIQDRDRARANRVMRCMMQMGKLELAPLREAYDAAA